MSPRSLPVLAAIAVLSFGPAATATPPRPRIVGVANIAYKVSSLKAARGYYSDVLGFQEAFTIKEAGDGPDLTCFKVNDRQYIEVSPILKDPRGDKFLHIAFETTGARELRDYLAGKGVSVPEKIDLGPDGNLSFTISDPDGNAVEFVEYLPESVQSRSFGKLMPDTRISDHIAHLGIYARNRAATEHFYKDILGFRPLTEADSGRTRSVALLVPDGNDFMEYTLNNSPQPPPRMLLDLMYHLCLGATDVQAAYRTAVERGYKPPHEPSVGQSGHRRVNFFDPDGNRTELMDRKPARNR
jgi:lactoylglutathione lyase